MVVFFQGRHTHNSEYNIELGDGGNMTCMVLNFIGWLFFFEEPGMGTAESLEIETKRSDLSIWPALILAVQK